MERNRIRRHLVVFAAAAPVMAFVTFFGLGQVCVLLYRRMTIIKFKKSGHFDLSLHYFIYTQNLSLSLRIDNDGSSVGPAERLVHR